MSRSPTASCAGWPLPRTSRSTGIDGLALANGWLIAIQNGIKPHRVVGWRLDPARDRSSPRRACSSAAIAAFDEPTLGVVVGTDFYFVANSQYGHFRRDGSLDETRLVGAVVLRTPLPR